ncbi:CRISPR-associated protein Cas6 [Deferribacter desulfuricans SSM1]|uniref:CRISPR-associated endoribonuclease n=1 Tax=Deferribacter desulfuricans (strain DSM 14783 / JCM 11476 / NBRC 101012 / SSM1) TaxID=639282 RepID=D3PBR5_DEFDS|nr:CRISPR-associated endoribonuclease Cas6 [Deferribacter desulfuricans]BAI80038.1 CRISPR-associated protein Cas6 [Deferribacter desulfuricans SSM1]
MKIKLLFNSDNEYIILPIHHNYLLQSMFYNNLPTPLANFLHEIGFFYYKRQFKLFTFSKIQSKYFELIREKSKITKIKYKTPITIFISSAINDFTKNWGETFLKKENIFLGKNPLYLESIEVLQNPYFEEDFIIKTLSPITAYKTFENGKKYYRYYSPSEPEFQYLIKENLRKKFEIITGEEISEFPIEIQPIKTKKVLFKYKDFPIEAYEGTFKIKTIPELFKTVYDAGLGAKNSQGFGMVEILNNTIKREKYVDSY